MSKHKTLAALVEEKFGGPAGWATASQVSDSLCRLALRGMLPKYPLMRQSMARTLGLTDDAFAALVQDSGKVRAT